MTNSSFIIFHGKNCLALGCDTAAVMTGHHKGVYAFCLKQQPSIYLARCLCHMLHHAAESAASSLLFKIYEVLVDTYFYLDKSSKRLISLEKIQKIYDVEHFKIIKHVSTRWLSIGRCIDRILENWDALAVVFKSELKENSNKSEHSQSRLLDRMYRFYKSPTNKLYCLQCFLQIQIQIPVFFNTLLNFLIQ
ncbi:Uncharacterised protein r2_g3960 [Pycnogonum litorale]